MLTLKKWRLTLSHTGHAHAHGEVAGHIRFEDGTYIHTSRIETCYKKESGELVCVTHSGSPYHLLPKDIDTDEMCMEETQKILDGLEMRPGDGLDEKLEIALAEVDFNKKGKVLQKQMEEREKRLRTVAQDAEKFAAEQMQDAELYLVMDGREALDAFWKHGGEWVRIRPSVHVGMFQDSVLVTDWEHGEVDFRYFPNWDIEPYHWSDGLENLYIYNAGAIEFAFQGTDERILCPPGKTVKIGKEQYRGEGLFSPDVVNGKSALAEMLQAFDREEDEDEDEDDPKESDEE